MSGARESEGTAVAERQAERCVACEHLASAHDGTSGRWCAATAKGTAVRRCICPKGSPLAP